MALEASVSCSVSNALLSNEEVGADFLGEFEMEVELEKWRKEAELEVEVDVGAGVV